MIWSCRPISICRWPTKWRRRYCRMRSRPSWMTSTPSWRAVPEHRRADLHGGRRHGSAADEPEFDFLSGTDEVATKLDLAQAYIDMGDTDGARDILNEVVTEGDAGQKSEAKEMLSRLA